MNHHLIPIPAGTPQSHCSSCGQGIWWAEHPATKRPHPISTNHAEAREPTPTTAGLGLSHFADCEFAEQHRRKPAPALHEGAREASTTMSLDAAERTPLIGDTTKWDGYGSKPLGVVPDKVLRIARRWMRNKLKESNTPDDRLARQIAAITVVLDHRAANSPQQSLAL